MDSTVIEKNGLPQSRFDDVCLVMLPGMDGTGMMFEPLLQCLPSNLNHKIIPIPEVHFSSHHELAETILSDLPDDQCIILAESFSGRTAYELCLLAPEKIIHVVFAASFLDNPNKLTALSSLLPLSLLKSTLVPNWLLKSLLFGSDQAPIKLLNDSLTKVDTVLLRNRLQIIANLTKPKKRLSIGATVINASKDHLVSSDAQNGIARVFLNTMQHEIEVGHFVLQAAPQNVAAIVTHVIEEYSIR
ncbi:hypothetical protein KUL42_11790 [Alteromonas sp. KUL42]|uniref:alpha/beta fold hydrolase n=1 Tax=Alteromonas sp. KUL42 TaxID=2480797 RepID=UPI00103626A6|nr:alpha/beta hydrolase [Alteromonas sp. KUL42]TAP37021.1 alpha/beta hydrolase [Alteromonas sp. KUL42]GEA06418.1 hypothetical protein KUL42_11790 [Alteromonas sp. KUL42]